MMEEIAVESMRKQIGMNIVIAASAETLVFVVKKRKLQAKN